MTFTEQNAKNAYDFTVKLAFPRLVGSEGEKAAQELLDKELDNIKNTYYTENLKCSAFPIGILFRILSPIGALFLLIAWLFFNNPIGLNNSIISLIFASSGFIWILSAGSILNRSFGWIPKIGAVYETKNFIAEITPTNPKAHLIYIAHYDTKSQFYPVLVRVIFFIGGFITGLLYGGRVIVGSVIFLCGTVPSGFWAPNWVDFLIMFIWNFLLIFNSVGNRSPGAIDNAASVAILLELSKLFQADPPQNLKLSFVITAAEELGLYGAADYVRRRRTLLDPKTTFFLNYDGIGSGKNLVLTSYGIPLKKTSQYLNNLIFEIVEEQSLKNEVGKIFLPIGAATDHVPIQRAGYEVSCLVSPMARTHTSKDSLNYVKVDSLKVVGIIGFELGKKLDQKFKN